MTRAQIINAAIEMDINATNSPLQGADFRFNNYYIGHTVCPFSAALAALAEVSGSAWQSMSSQVSGASYAEAWYSAALSAEMPGATIVAHGHCSFGAVTGRGVDWDVMYLGNGQVAVSVAFERFGSIVENMIGHGWTPGPCKLDLVNFRPELHPAHVAFLDWKYDGKDTPSDWELQNVPKKDLARKYGWDFVGLQSGDTVYNSGLPGTEFAVRVLSRYGNWQAAELLDEAFKDKLQRQSVVNTYYPVKFPTSIGLIFARSRSSQTLHFQGQTYTARTRWGVKYVKIQGVYFLWFDEFDKHAEGRTFSEAFTVLKDRLNGWIVGKRVSLARVVAVHRYCLPGTRHWLLGKFPHIGRLLEPYKSWEDVPRDIMDIEWDFASRDLFDGRV